jgi:16S rRNA (uracil1498-N3)-methyltransferase
LAKPLTRLFTDAPLAEDALVALSQAQAHYLGTVMRKTVGDEVLLFNGRDGEWRGALAELSKKSGVVMLAEQTRAQVSTVGPTLCFAPVKRAPLDQMAQKATELGAVGLQPVQTARTIVTRVKEERLHANAVEAAEQCERLDVPVVAPLVKLERLIADWAPAQGRLIFCDEAGDEADARWGGDKGRAKPMMQALAAFKGSEEQWGIVIGPEGGFTPEERDLLRGQEFVVPVTLGPRILRADTAAFAAMSLWQVALGGF